MDGHEVCRRLKGEEATRNIPVIFVTAHDDAAEETRGFDVGAVDFIATPVNPATVRARVKTLLTLEHQSDLLRQMVFIDGLTGVSNRRCFDEQLQVEWRRAVCGAPSIGLLILDIDHFKRYWPATRACRFRHRRRGHLQHRPGPGRARTRCRARGLVGVGQRPALLRQAQRPRTRLWRGDEHPIVNGPRPGHARASVMSCRDWRRHRPR